MKNSMGAVNSRVFNPSEVEAMRDSCRSVVPRDATKTVNGEEFVMIEVFKNAANRNDGRLILIHRVLVIRVYVVKRILA